MTYDSKYNKQKEEYRKEKFKRVGIDFDRNYYTETLKPFADANNMPVGTFIKLCVDAYISAHTQE